MEIKSTGLGVNDLSERVISGLRKALRQLVETSAAKNESLIIGDKNGNAHSVPAKELLKKMSQ